MSSYTIEEHDKYYLLIDLERNQILIKTSLKSIAVNELKRIHTAAKQQVNSWHVYAKVSLP